VAGTSQMQKLLQRLELHDFGRRSIVDVDEFYIDRAHGVEIIWSDGEVRFPFYCGIRGRHFMILPKGVRGLRILFTLFIEAELSGLETSQ
jgi:hypothetical protein